MGKILVVAEKPAAAADMAKVVGANQKKNGYFEGDKYIVTYAVGHLVRLKYPEEHNPEFKKWKLEDLPFCFSLSESLKVIPESAGQFKTIKSLINRPDVESIINGGDAGREGYLIQEWIYRLAGNRKQKKVLWASSLTEEALKKAFHNLKNPKDFQLLLEEGEARALGDYYLGINYSRALTKTIGCRDGHNILLRYGRCQTQLLNHIVMRDRAIESFKSVPYYNISINYESGFSGIMLDDSKKNIKNFASPVQADEIIQKLKADPSPATVTSCTCEDKAQSAPQLYNLAELQKTMGKLYGMTAEETLAVAQKLYETYKILSYPRTDSRALSMDLFNEIKEHIACCTFDEYKEFADLIVNSDLAPDKKYFNDIKVTDHHALIPTINPNMEAIYHSKLSDTERKVFDCVIRSFLAIFLPPYEYQVTQIIAEKASYFFASKGTVIKNAGYKAILKDAENPKKEKEEPVLPQLEKYSTLAVKNVIRLDKKTKPPVKYTVSNIIALMEKYGIGTSATRAEIIRKLMDERAPYVTLDKGKYTSTPLGRQYIDVIPDILKDENLSQKFEEKLNLISAGTLTKEQFLTELHTEQVQIIEQLKSMDATISAPARQELPCPICGKPVRSSEKNYYCSGYKQGCKFMIRKEIAGKKITPAMVTSLITKGKTNKIKGFKKKNSDETFDARLVLDQDGNVKFSSAK